jgi:hypothetical protein
MLHLSRDLARIRLDVPIACSLSECLWNLRREAAIRKFEELEFGGLVKVLGESEDNIDLFTAAIQEAASSNN